MIKVQADTINGVYKVDEFEDGTVIDGADFLGSLKGCGDDEILACVLTDEQARIVDEEYGIH